MIKKRIIIFGTIVGMLLILFISFQIVFAIKEVKVNFYYSTLELSEESVLLTLENNNVLPYGSNIFSIKSDDLKRKIEEVEPKIKVNNIEMVFPNKVKINCEERADAFYTQVGSKAIILDSELRVLDKVSAENVKDKTFLKIENSFVSSQDVKLGYEFTVAYSDEIAKVLTSLISYYQNKTNQTVFSKHFSQIDILQGYNEEKQKVLKMVFHLVSGKTVELENPIINMNKRLSALLEFVSDNETITQDKIVII